MHVHRVSLERALQDEEYERALADDMRREAMETSEAAIRANADFADASDTDASDGEHPTLEELRRLRVRHFQRDMQCTATTRNGRRCLKRALSDNVCGVHKAMRKTR